jgi:hypothetical protein
MNRIVWTSGDVLTFRKNDEIKMLNVIIHEVLWEEKVTNQFKKKHMHRRSLIKG